MARTDACYDAVVVGAGPAGSAAAMLLARAGRRVLLIDKQRFPREKACGGCISGAGVQWIQRLLGPGRTPPGLPSTRISFVIGGRRLTCDPRGATWLVRRTDLDDWLARSAADGGAELHVGESASIELHDERWAVVVGGCRIRAGVVLVATGVNGLAQRVGIEHHVSRTAMIAQQWCQPPRPPLPRLGEVELHWLRGGYIGLATPRPDECVIALAASASRERGENPFERLRRLNSNAPIFAALPSDAPRRFGARGTAGFPWLPARVGDRNLLLVGDAAGYAEPFSGEGIGQALYSAACAAIAALSGDAMQTLYAERMGWRHRRVIRRTQMLSRFLQSRIVQCVARSCPVLPERLLSRLVARVHVGPQHEDRPEGRRLQDFRLEYRGALT